MRKLAVSVGIILLSNLALAEEKATSQPQKPSTIKSAEKRGKKAMMCPTCGKPESKCDCPGEKKGEHEEHDKQPKVGKPEKKS